MQIQINNSCKLFVVFFRSPTYLERRRRRANFFSIFFFYLLNGFFPWLGELQMAMECCCSFSQVERRKIRFLYGNFFILTAGLPNFVETCLIIETLSLQRCLTPSHAPNKICRFQSHFINPVIQANL